MKILLIGDSCKDIYHYGKCKRINPEAPVPILEEDYSETKEGMSSNVYENLLSLGVDVTHLKNKEQIEKHRIVDLTYRQQLIRYDIGEKNIKPLELKKLESGFDIIVISDYNKGFITYDVAKYICEFYKDIPIFVDTKKKDLKCFNNCYIKINNIEYELLEDYNKDCELIVTLGGEGALYKDQIYKTKKVEVYDVCGAGDVFLSALVYKFSKDNNIKSAIHLANRLASYTVTKLGSYVLTKEDIHNLENESS
jgi:D-beta-D-heptose 7-phosphate kinase/D-beta-D-heptose 1-phosphate adenosyltransferase